MTSWGRWAPVRKVWAAIITALILGAAAAITALAGDPDIVQALGPFAVPVGAFLAAVAAYLTRAANRRDDTKEG